MSGHLTSEHHANHYMRSLMWTANCELWICRKIHWKSPIKYSDPQFGHGRRPSTSSCNNNINRHRNKYINKISGRKHMKVFGIIKKKCLWSVFRNAFDTDEFVIGEWVETYERRNDHIILSGPTMKTYFISITIFGRPTIKMGHKNASSSVFVWLPVRGYRDERRMPRKDVWWLQDNSLFRILSLLCVMCVR